MTHSFKIPAHVSYSFLILKKEAKVSKHNEKQPERIQDAGLILVSESYSFVLIYLRVETIKAAQLVENTSEIMNVAHLNKKIVLRKFPRIQSFREHSEFPTEMRATSQMFSFPEQATFLEWEFGSSELGMPKAEESSQNNFNC